MIHVRFFRLWPFKNFRYEKCVSTWADDNPLDWPKSLQPLDKLSIPPDLDEVNIKMKGE